MTTISAKPILSSVNTVSGDLLDTLLLTYPRWIHAEARTHRVVSLDEDEGFFWEPRTPSFMDDPNISRNAASSRAIPVKRMIEEIIADPAIPLFWGKNQKGMQADEECNEILRNPDRPFKTEWTREEAWLDAMRQAIEWAEKFADAGYHKQIVNRLLEPFSHITVLATATATAWESFLHLRDHKDAEPHIQRLAREISIARANIAPQNLRPGEWHLPFIRPEDIALHEIGALKRLSGARCASTSYNTVEGYEMDVERADAICTKLMTEPLHASPFEHVAQADSGVVTLGGIAHWDNKREHGNFVGFRQWRRQLPGGITNWDG